MELNVKDSADKLASAKGKGKTVETVVARPTLLDLIRGVVKCEVYLVEAGPGGLVVHAERSLTESEKMEVSRIAYA